MSRTPYTLITCLCVSRVFRPPSRLSYTQTMPKRQRRSHVRVERADQKEEVVFDLSKLLMPGREVKVKAPEPEPEPEPTPPVAIPEPTPTLTPAQLKRIQRHKVTAARKVLTKRLHELYPGMADPDVFLQFITRKRGRTSRSRKDFLRDHFNLNKLSIRWPKSARYVYVIIHDPDEPVTESFVVLGSFDCRVLRLGDSVALSTRGVRSIHRAKTPTDDFPARFIPGSPAFYTGEMGMHPAGMNLDLITDSVAHKISILELLMQNKSVPFEMMRMDEQAHVLVEYTANLFLSQANAVFKPSQNTNDLERFYTRWLECERQLLDKRLSLHYRDCLPEVMRSMGFDVKDTTLGYSVPFAQVHLWLPKMNFTEHGPTLRRGRVHLKPWHLQETVCMHWKPDNWVQDREDGGLAGQPMPKTWPENVQFLMRTVVFRAIKQLFDVFMHKFNRDNPLEGVPGLEPPCLHRQHHQHDLKKTDSDVPHLTFMRRQAYGQAMAAMRNMEVLHGHSFKWPRSVSELVDVWMQVWPKAYQGAQKGITSQYQAYFSKPISRGPACRWFMRVGLCPFNSNGKYMRFYKTFSGTLTNAYVCVCTANSYADVTEGLRKCTGGFVSGNHRFVKAVASLLWHKNESMTMEAETQEGEAP